MRSNGVVLLAAGAALLAAQPFAFHRVIVRPGNELDISTKGAPDPALIATLTAPANRGRWHVNAAPSSGSSMVLDVTAVTWFSVSGAFALTYDPAPLAGRDPQQFSWSVYFEGAPVPLNASFSAGHGLLSTAKSKQDADIYFFGSYLAGESTKPIYAIDFKLAYTPEIQTSGYFFGIESAVVVNSGVAAPAARSRVDPDSITTGAALRFMKRRALVDVNVARGEFSRKYSESNFVPSGTVQWILPPKFFSKRHAAVFYPLIGIEAGANLNQPSVILKQPVDFRNYGLILRGVAGAYAAWYIARPNPDPSEPYRFEMYGNYTARLPATDEPFVNTSFIGGQNVARVVLSTNPRHYLESGVIWNVSAYVGLQVKYTYGSLPPLFQFTGHQVSAGLTFKAKLRRSL